MKKDDDNAKDEKEIWAKTGAINGVLGVPAGALWGVPEHIRQRSLGLLDVKMLRALEAFAERFGR